MALSVIIPTHRRPALLAEAIDSVLGQSLTPHEILVVDDADDAATREYVAEAAAQATIPICYLPNNDPGACNSRNLGARSARGNLIGFLDDDDLWRSDFVVRLTTAIKDAGAELAIGGVVRHESGLAPAPRVQRDDLDGGNVLDEPGSMTGSNFVIAREVFDRVGGFDPAMTVFNDWDLFVRLIDANVRYVVVPEPLVDWREHGGERIATFSLRRAAGIEHFVARYRDRLSSQLIRDHLTTAFGIRRRKARSVAQRLYWSLRLAIAHGPTDGARRLIRR